MHVIFREPTLEEQLKGISKPKTHFGKACEKLGIEIIAANSPQAKSRIERSNGVHQDRLVKDLRLEKKNTIEKANKFIKCRHIKKHNKKFTIKPENETNVHVDLIGTDDL